MRRAAPVVAALFCILPAAAPGAASAADRTPAPPAAEKARELKALKSRIESLKREIESAEGSRADVLDELRQSERAISEINRALRDLGGELAEANASLARSRRESAALRARIEDQRTRLARLLVQQYEQGGPDGLRLLFQAEEPDRLGRDLEYYAHIARARTRLIAALRRDLAAVEALERETLEKSQTLARLEARQREQRQALEREAAARRAALARLEKQIAARRQEVQRLKQDEQRLSRLVERLSRAVAERSRPARGPGPRGGTAPPQEPADAAFARLKGTLKLPVAGEITHRFGTPRPETGMPWKGVFIRAPEGSPVRALAEGRVVFADWLRGFGNLLIIDHGDGYMSLYGHNQALYRQVGERVAAGEVVGAAGDSGGPGETGLYFEVRFKGKPVDPLQWVGRR